MKPTISERVALPKGYRFEIIHGMFDSEHDGTRGCLDNTVDVRLWYKQKCIGHVELAADYRRDKRNKLSYTTHSYLAPLYRNKGLGARMYARAIIWCLARKYKVHSYHHPSSDAQRVWRSRYLTSKFMMYLRPKDSDDYGRGYGPAWNAELKNKRK
ncbi:MAG TPA: GNAT family N-acetyltransferase [Candidatus Saccharimonadales bacterium]